MHNASEVTWLDDLGVVRVRGPDAARFLQGQLSNDLTRLDSKSSLLAGYHTPQGRTIAVLRLVYWDEGDIVAVVPRELAGLVVSRISKFVLRSKVKITDESGRWRIGGVTKATKVAATGESAVAVSEAPATVNEPAAAVSEAPATVGKLSVAVREVSEAAVELPAAVGAQVRAGDAVFVRLAGEDRALVVFEPVGGLPTDSAVAGLENWRRLEVAAGEPQVYAATSEEFVAQMLNLDVLNGIAFDKGCYTGQEVIARAHYRGRVKRRMQRFVTRDAQRLAPGDSGQLPDGRTFKVVLAAQLDDGRCDFLAVAPFAGVETEAGAAPAVTVAVPVAADAASLPYALPA
jgi:folate-binding protein YgfZ